MKKIILLALLLLLFGTHASAEDIRVEGEQYEPSLGNITPSVLPEGDENPVMVISNWWGASTQYTVGYSFEAPTAGGYLLSAVTTDIDSVYTSNFYYRVNGGDWVYSADVFEKISHPGASFGSSNMYLYQLGTVELKSGANTIEFLVKEARESQNNWAVFYLDYFTLSKQEFGLDSVIPAKPSHVFEPSDACAFEIRFTDYPKANTSYTVLVEDYFHKPVKAAQFTLGTAELSKDLDFGTLAPGWYRMLISDGEKNLYQSGFAVVHPLSQRPENPHFAMDFAGMALTTGKTEVQNLGRALRLAGVNFVRERYYWQYSDLLYQYNNETVAGTGMDVINMFHDSRTADVSLGHMADDLFKVYEFQKGYSEKYAGLVDYMEVWNEEDTSFANETADRYAAFLKAAAIGIRDGNAGMGISHGGFAQAPDSTKYIDFCMMNDFMEYTDLYNYHAYASGGDKYETTPSLGRSEITANRDILTAYGYENRRVWVTEGGISIGKEQERSRTQQARAAVINNIQSVANGTDKHFFFVVPQYYESGREFGVFCKDKTPSASYTAMENLTYQLGSAEFKGIFRDLTERIRGYLFDNGTRDVGVFWAESGENFVQVQTTKPVTVVDMMGGEKTINPTNGIISLSVDMNPVYVLFGETVSASQYLADQKAKPSYERVNITDAKRIVLQPNFESKCYVEEKMKGYLMIKNEDNLCTIRVYNFSDKEQSGTIYAKISDKFVLDKTEQNVTVGAMSSADVTFKIRVANDVKTAEKGFVQFSGVMNGEEITKSTAQIRCRIKDTIELGGTFSRAKWSSYWQTGGSTSSGTVKVSNPSWLSSEVKFVVNMNANGWCYPNFKVTEQNSLKNTTGIRFSVKGDEDIGQAVMHCFAYMTDGRKYFEGNENGKIIKKGYTDYYIPWDEMVRQHLPEGVDPNKEFSVADIQYIAIGVNVSGTGSFTYYLNNIGWYTDDTKNDTIEWDELTLAGIADEEMFYQGSVPMVTATLPANDTIKKIKVYLSGREYQGYEQGENQLFVDLGKLSCGSYTLLVTAENEFGYIYRDAVDFMIQ
ncbi:MAG: hypothetical protein E7397_04655 [Ruminococcaceae bacterium]|nr:hypothetical protein [Oscillospiraceae bacterium]